MDFVWIYRHSAAASDELRWSIRSVVRNYIGDSRIIIAGDRPPWYCGICLDIPPVNPRWKDSNIKLLEACRSSLVGDEFVAMMDDLIFLQNVDENMLRIPRGKRINPEPSENDSSWMKRCKHSMSFFTDPIFYALHVPRVFEKQKILDIHKQYDLETPDHIPENLYGNIYWDNHQTHRGFLHYQKKPFEKIRDIDVSVVTPIFNWGNKCWDETLRDWLKRKFPDQTEYEIFGDQFISHRESIRHKMLNQQSLRPVNTWECEFRGKFLETVTSKVCPRKPEKIYACSKFEKSSRRHIGINGVQGCNRCPVTLEKMGL